MADESTPAGEREPDSPEVRPNTYELIDGRKCLVYWIPRYIVGLYAERIGQRGLSIYCSLAWWVTSDAPHHRPTLAEIGRMAGSSRSTVWRGLKVLEEHNLIRITPQVGKTGRRAHVIQLTHPPDAADYESSFGTPSAGGNNLTPPRAQDDTSARSKRARGAPKLSAPSAINGSFGEEGGEAAAPAPPPPSAQPEEESAAGRLAAQWLALIAVRGKDVVNAHREEAAPMLAELLRRGWPEAILRAAIDDPNRDRFEWPRQFRERFKGRPRVARTPRAALQTPQDANGAIPGPIVIHQAVIDLARRKGLNGVAAQLERERDARLSATDQPPTESE